MDAVRRARIVREVGELLASPRSLRDVWPACAALLCELSGASSVRIVAPGEPIAADEDGLALRFGGEVAGVFAIREMPDLDEESRALLEACLHAVATRLHVERFIQSSERFEELAHLDPLTGVANRRRFDETLEATCARAREHGVPLALAVVDVDFFKAFNDGYGHQAGDACLRAIAQALSAVTRRPGDLLARYGGEEFVMLFYGVELDEAIALCEAACEGVAALAIAHRGSSLGYVTVSIGAVAIRGGESGVELFHDADEALYRAKAGGRNRVVAESYVSARVPAARTILRSGSNVPKEPAPLVGRRRELRDLDTALGAHRVVTIAGAGGCGKTRLAIELAARASGAYDDGVWFAELAAVHEGSAVPSAVAALFDERIDGTVQALIERVREKQLLLVLDNCEHLVDAIATFVQALVAACPGVRVLMTSREPLGIAGEFVYALATFAIPPEGELQASEARGYDCVEMFVQRLRALDPRFALGEREVLLVAAICRRIDGIALAIELAAPRAAAVGLETLERELREHAFPATMSSFVAWSYNLLTENEQRVFRRIAVFRGGFPVEAAAAVCWDLELSPKDVGDALVRLARKSLVVGEPSEARAQLRMLETIREFAFGAMREHEDVAEICERHARWVLDFVDARSERTPGQPQRAWLSALLTQIDNMRAALQWTLDEGNDVRLGVQLAVALLAFFRHVVPVEGLRTAQRALDALPPGEMLYEEARLNLEIGALRLLPALEERRAAERALELFRALDRPSDEAVALRVLAQAIGWYFRDERAYADELACQAIELSRNHGNKQELIAALRTRGLTIDISEFPIKRAVLLEALELARAERDAPLVGSCLTWISEMEFSAGERERAYAYGKEALAIAEAEGLRDLHGSAAANFAIYAAALGEWEVASGTARRALNVARASHVTFAITYALQAFAMVAFGCGDVVRAARLIGFCDARDGVLHAPRQADQCEDITQRELLAALHESLGASLAMHLAEGAAMSEEAAVALALG